MEVCFIMYVLLIASGAATEGAFAYNECLAIDIRDYCLTFSQFRSRLKTLLYREAYVLSITASAFVIVPP